MLRGRFLRAAVTLRRWKRQAFGPAGRRGLRRSGPFVASFAFNIVLILVLAVGYSSFVAKGVRDGGFGERVVSVTLFEAEPSPSEARDIKADETESPEDAELGAEALPEGNAAESGEDLGETAGDEAPEAAEGQSRAIAKAGADIPQIALPETDPGEGRPDGLVGVDCYRVFADDRDKALECAGRAILSGWRAEAAEIGEDWASFARTLGTENRAIRYGPLRAAAPRGPQTPGSEPMAVPPEVIAAYEAQIEELRRKERIRRFGRDTNGVKSGQEASEEDMTAATYDPVSTDVDF